jgi:hypothetical protein
METVFISEAASCTFEISLKPSGRSRSGLLRHENCCDQMQMTNLAANIGGETVFPRKRAS